MDLLAFILSLVGAASWLPTIYRLLRRPVVYGKILSWVHAPGSSVSIPDDIHGMGVQMSGTVYFLKTSLTATRNPVAVRNIKISIFDKDGNEYEADQFFVPRYILWMNGKQFYPNLQPSDFLPQVVFLPENEPINRYSLFCLNGYPNAVANRIHFEISDIKGRTFVVDADMPEPALAGFERSLWIPVEEP